jgi:alpha-tubulin suppressor-like RCC1 family protein
MVAGLTRATAVAVGTDHACALLLDGTIQCWGSNVYGQLGNGSWLYGGSLTATGTLSAVSPSSVTETVALPGPTAQTTTRLSLVT